MTIEINDGIGKFGTQDTLGTSSASVADAAFSIASDLSTWTNDDDAEFASVVFTGDFAAAVDAGSVVTLHIRSLNIQSTNDEEIPDANFSPYLAGSFPLNDVATSQSIKIIIALPNNAASQGYEYYIENKSGQSLDAGWDIFPTPKAIGPATA